MLIYDFREIGNRLLAFRKKAGLTQIEVAEAAGLSDRTYADIERGSVNMRIETILRICDALHIPAIFYKHYPSFASGQMNVSELARICGLSRPTVYKYLKMVG